jgi:hypothetical protein
MTIVPVPVPSKLVTHLVRSIERAWLRPKYIRNEGQARADARAYEVLALRQAEHDSERILAGVARLDAGTGRLIELRTDEPAGESPIHPLAIARSNADALVLRHEINVERATVEAEDILQQDNAEPPAEYVDPDWLNRWRAGAGDVTSADVRQMWARILAGEITAPGTFSLRTLHVLSLLTSKDADIVTRLMTLAVAESVHKYNELDEAGLSFDDCLTLDSMGLITGVQSGAIKATIASIESTQYFAVLAGGARALVLHHEDAAMQFVYPAYPVTHVWNELCKLGSFVTPDAYLLRLAERAKESGFRVDIAHCAIQDGHFALNDVLPV